MSSNNDNNLSESTQNDSVNTSNSSTVQLSKEEFAELLLAKKKLEEQEKISLETKTSSSEGEKKEESVLEKYHRTEKEKEQMEIIRKEQEKKNNEYSKVSDELTPFDFYKKIKAVAGFNDLSVEDKISTLKKECVREAMKSELNNYLITEEDLNRPDILDLRYKDSLNILHKSMSRHADVQAIKMLGDKALSSKPNVRYFQKQSHGYLKHKGAK